MAIGVGYRRFNFTTRNVYYLHIFYAPSNGILITDYMYTKVFIILNSLLNRLSQLIHQCFTCQLVQFSVFANILPLQNFSTYSTPLHMPIHMHTVIITVYS